MCKIILKPAGIQGSDNYYNKIKSYNYHIVNKTKF